MEIMELLWLIGAMAALLGTVFAVFAGWVLLRRMVRYGRGHRDRLTGITCLGCRRRAFPLEGSGSWFRCPLCGLRFEGPRHLG